MDGPDMNEAGLSKVTITYEDENGKEYSAIFRVTVYDPEDLRADSIKVVREPAVSYTHLDVYKRQH